MCVVAVSVWFLFTAKESQACTKTRDFLDYLASAHLNLRFHSDICFICVCRIVTLTLLVTLYSCESTVLWYWDTVAGFADSLVLLLWPKASTSCVHLSGLQILASGETD